MSSNHPQETTPPHVIRDISKKAADDILSAIERNIFLVDSDEARQAISLACLRAAMAACIEIHLISNGRTSIGSNGKVIGETAISIITQMADAGMFALGEKSA